MDYRKRPPVPARGRSAQGTRYRKRVPSTTAPSPTTRSFAARTALTAGKVLVGMTSTLAFLAMGMAYYKIEDLSAGMDRSNAIDGNAPKSKDGAVNILLMGLDSRKDQNGNPLPQEILDKLHAGLSSDGGYNTNTLILLHVPNNGSKATAISIPRDDYVDVQGLREYKKAKIKEAYGLAKAFTEEDLYKKGVTDRQTLEKQGREAGRKKTIETVRNFLGGIPIDHFAEINLAGFYDLATALDGVDVCLKAPVNDEWSGANFPAGRQTLNGSQALAFVRQRHHLNNGDLDRTHRQQAFLASATQKLRSTGTFTDPNKLQKLIDVAKKDVAVDAGLEMFGFARQAQALSRSSVEFHTLPIEGYGNDDSGPNPQDINLVDVPKIQAIVRDLIGEKKPGAPRVPISVQPPPRTVDVHYDPSEEVVAAKVADSLAGTGFKRGQKSVTTSGGHTTSGIYYSGASKSDAQKIAKILGGLTVTVDSTVPNDHVRVYLGKNFTMPATLRPTEPAQQTKSTSPSADSVIPTAGPQGPIISGGDIPCID